MIFKSVVIGGYNPFDNYLCPAYSCFLFFLPSRDPEMFVEIAPWPRFAYERALVSYWHPPKSVLLTRLHSNTCSYLLFFFYLLETLKLHLVARRLSPGGPSRGPSLWWNLQLPPHIPEITVRQRIYDVLHLLLLTWNAQQIKMPVLDDSVATEFWRKLLHWRRYCHPKVTNSSIAMQETKNQILKLKNQE